MKRGDLESQIQEGQMGFDMDVEVLGEFEFVLVRLLQQVHLTRNRTLHLRKLLYPSYSPCLRKVSDTLSG